MFSLSPTELTLLTSLPYTGTLSLTTKRCREQATKSIDTYLSVLLITTKTWQYCEQSRFSDFKWDTQGMGGSGLSTLEGIAAGLSLLANWGSICNACYINSGAYETYTFS